MNKVELTRFLSKRGFVISQIQEFDNGYLVELEGGVQEAVHLFKTLNETTQVIFSLKPVPPPKPSFFSKVRGAITNAFKQPKLPTNTR